MLNFLAPRSWLSLSSFSPLKLSSNMTADVPKTAAPQQEGPQYLRVTYNDIHQIVRASAQRIVDEFRPDLIIAIGGGGYVPARILRTFLKKAAPEGKRVNIPVQAIGLSLYEEVGAVDGSEATPEEKLGKEVVRTQWLDLSTLGSKPLIGRRILIVDEVDDSRTTLGYACSELQKDIDQHLAELTPEQRAAAPETAMAVFVVHNKLKPKDGVIPESIQYFSGADTEDKWLCYPWEQEDILEHDRLAAEDAAAAKSARGFL